MSQLDLVSMCFTGRDHDTNLLEICAVHQVHAASVMISIHMDTSLESLQHLLVSTSCACSASPSVHLLLGEQVFHSCRDGQVFPSCRDDKVFICLTVGSTPDTCFGDVLHVVRQPGILCTRALRAVVMVLSLSGFSDIFSIMWSNSSLMVIPGKTS